MPPKPSSPESNDAESSPVLPIERIVLTGFMGSGKTTIGRGLAERLGWRFIDLDHAIEQREGRAVARIFAESGEAAFRRLESEALDNALREHHIVVALGGGALETAKNRDALRSAPQTRTILLSASFETLYGRCRDQTLVPSNSALQLRPLLGDREAAAARLERRDPIYRQQADLVLDTTGQQVHESLEALLSVLATKL